MSANLLPVPPHSAAVPSTSASGHHKPAESQRKSWWTPLFGWSSEPDYINSSTNTDKLTTANSTTFPARSSAVTESDLDLRVPARSRVVNFTDEKARKLRMLTVETESFRDAMYHSAIASRFASDFSDRSGV